MISPDMFPSTEMEISEKWFRSSANYISENWKRNNEHLTMLSKTAKLGYLCWNRIKWCRFWDTDITVGIDVHKKEKFIQFLSSNRQKRGFSVDINVQLNGRCKFWNKIVFRVSSFCTNCLRSLIISFQITNRKWSGTRFFIHPGVECLSRHFYFIENWSWKLNGRCKFWNKIVFRVSSFCTNCLRSLIISFQITNRKWSGTRFFIHPGVECLSRHFYFIENWSWKLNIEFRISSVYFTIIVFKGIHFISFLPCINDFSIITPFTYWQIHHKFGELLPCW